jgi:predicted metal-dependent hydrolase
VILHELTHLLHAGHGPSFWKILEVYPHTERARGFLEGLEYSHTVLGLDWEHADVDGPGEGADS